ncbi:hypothetical protein HHK36_024421 [Tetracentron sinense]|uniref:Cytochrome P450 n=1 Tax=Tetracentron sinense TaxID=13715 RepID=A0A834YP09_TETSI|nr:hypothetical protein HHK36_024421 [Tetracentron sinense]
MMELGTTIVLLFLSTYMCLYLIFGLVKFLYKVWWNPIRIRKVMASQGIKGPSYRFIHGSTKEVTNMINDSMSRPMELSHDVFPRLQPHIHSWIKTYGMNFLTWYGSKAQLIVTEPELIKEILSNRDGTYPKTEAEDFVKKLLGDGIVTTEGKKWSKHRKLANHAFNAENLKGMIPEMIASVEMMLERWKHQEGKEIEVFEEFKVLTSEVISRTAFGSSYREGKNIFEMFMKLAFIISKNLYIIRFPGIGKLIQTSDDIESEKLERGIQESVVQIIKRREEKVKTRELDDFGDDFLGFLLKAHHHADENKRLSIEDMVDECKTFYIAGHETTTSLLTWTILLLAIDTDWQEKARKEVIELFGKRNPNIDDNGIARLKTMNMIINESLRLYPPVLGLTRRVAKEVRLGKLILPPNIEVNLSTLAVHHNPHIWGEDVHIFNPERFSEGVAKATNNNTAAFIPFSLGPRNCVGLNFVFIEAKLSLSMILQRYTFTLSPGYVHMPVLVLTTRPKHGLQIILHPL